MQVTTIYDEQFRLQAEVSFGDVNINGQPLDWRWLKAQELQESRLDARAVSGKGAKGLMQLMPGTSAEIARRLHLPDDPFDPLLNIKFGVFYDRQMWRIWSKEQGLERLRFMFASYNAGAGNIIKAQKLASPTDQWWAVAKELPKITGIGNARETTGYVKKIDGYHRQLIGG
ncbi:MAG: transglycosylase SLT domain-containing protein [Chlorobium sp.]|nr:transglycosylase SLT domain-containing protein [Chlorobium sp.]